jgi:hypothetical protein
LQSPFALQRLPRRRQQTSKISKTSQRSLLNSLGNYFLISIIVCGAVWIKVLFASQKDPASSEEACPQGLKIVAEGVNPVVE